jgi:ABC-type transporter Mla subunit MlaD
MATSTATNHWKLGLFVVVAIAALAATLFWLGANRFQRESFEAVSYFDESVQGLDVGSPVKFRGVPVGTVADITIAPDHRLVQVTAEIYLDAVVRLGLRVPDPASHDPFIDPRLRVQLVAAGITGVRFIQTDFFDPARNPPPQLPFEPPWNYVPSTPSTLKGLEDAAVDILARFPAVEEGVVQTTIDLRKTLASVDRLANGLSAENGSWNALLVQLRDAAAHVQKAVDDAQLGPTTAALREATGSLGEAATQTSAQVDEVRDELRLSLAALRDTLESVRTLADSLQRDPSVIVRGPHVDAPERPEVP